MNPHHHSQDTVEPVAERYRELAAPRVAYVLYTVAAVVFAGLAVSAGLIDDGFWFDVFALGFAAACGWTLHTIRAMREEANTFDLVDADIAHATVTGTPVRPVRMFAAEEENAA